ncbi:MAG: tetratricopeptide repeat protein [Chloroflexi bacterium]|nr:tetratricopeptide repeat protein [Chloroflexota bacterium]
MQQSFLCPRCNNVAFLGQRYCGFCDLAFLYSCNSCGSALIPEAVFCGNCGTQIDWEEPAQQQIQPVLPQVPEPATAPVQVEQPVDIGQPGAHHPATHGNIGQPALLQPGGLSQETPEASPPAESPPAALVAPVYPVPAEHKAKAAEHHERSLALLKDGHYSLAIDELSKALQYDPSTAIIYMLRGGALYKSGDLDMALADLDRAIELDPNLAMAFYNRGNVYYYKQDFDRAIADFSRAIAIENTDSAAFHNCGCALMMKGQFYEAIDDINRSIQLDPKDPRVYCSRGSAYTQTGQTQKAAEDYRQVKGMTADPAIIHKAERALRDLGEG